MLLVRRTLLLCLGISALSGCMVGPDYQRPSSMLPNQFMSQLDTAAKDPAARAELNAELADWWRSFDDPVLTGLIEQALKQNLELTQAGARLDQARAALSGANASLLPGVGAEASAARAYQSTETQLGRVLDTVPGYDRWGNQYEANLSASWEVDLFGGLRRGREAVLANYQAAQAATYAVQLSVAAQTADTYIAIRGLQTRIGIAEDQVETQTDLVKKVGLLDARGLVPHSQLWQTQGELAQLKASLPVLNLNLESAMNAIDILLGAAPGTYRSQLAQPMPLPQTPDITDLGSPADLLIRRPDLIVAERKLAAASAGIGQAMAEYYPKFSITGLLGSATTIAADNLFSSGASQAAGMAGLRWRLFDFGRINAQIDAAKGRDAEALAAYRQAVLQATQEVENAFVAMVNREEQAVILAEAQSALSRSRAASFAGYQRGAASLIDVLNADKTLLQATDAKAQAQTDAARAAVATYRALGGGWQPAEH